MKPKFYFNQLYLSLFIIALLLSALITMALYFGLTPWEMETIKTEGPGYRLPYEFRDLNHDGFSEQVQISNDPELNIHYLVFLTHQGAIIDQFNITETIIPDQMMFADYTGDHYDECFVFTVKADSVFLYLFDIIGQKTLIKRQFLIQIPTPHPFYRITDAKLYDINNDSDKELLFLLHPGRAPKPRGLYVYNLQKRKIINRFENQSSKEKLVLYDLNGDGQEEIIVLGKANGNDPENAPFTDYKNWVFILDHNLKWRFPPLPYGGYPSAFDALPVQIHEKRYLLIAHYRAAPEHQQKPLGLYLVDSRGRFARKRYFESENMAGTYAAVDNAENPKKFFVSPMSNQLLCFDAEFNLIKQKTTPYNCLRIKGFQDIDRDGKAELITNSANGTQIFDQDFNLLAETKTIGHISFRQQGPKLPLEISVSDKRFYHYRIVKNPFIQWLPALFVCFIVVFFGLLLLINKLAILLYTYFSYFIYSLKQTSNGVVLLRHNGHISYFNSRVQNILELPEPIEKKWHFGKAFNEYPEILGCITESIQNKEAVQKDFSVSKGRRDIKGQISVIPFKTNFNYIYAYLLEIRDLTEPIISDRQKVWSRTVKKMAHDIKTPLAAVQLNLETLQLKLADLHAESSEKTEQDFILINKELNRVREMTRQFLKFSNLEAPTFSEVVLSQILQKVKSHFHSYFSGQLTLDIKIDDDADKLIADENQLVMAFQIFIENAIDALRGKGRIAISSNLEQELDSTGRENIVIEIADSGPGILAEQQGKIFEPYFTTKKEGTGMGLAIAQKIIRDHSGEIELVSRKNFGTVFRITLPKLNGNPQKG